MIRSMEAFVGTGTGLSGVKAEMTGTILTYMQDRERERRVRRSLPYSEGLDTIKVTYLLMQEKEKPWSF